MTETAKDVLRGVTLTVTTSLRILRVDHVDLTSSEKLNINIYLRVLHSPCFSSPCFVDTGGNLEVCDGRPAHKALPLLDVKIERLTL